MRSGPCGCLSKWQPGKGPQPIVLFSNWMAFPPPVLAAGVVRDRCDEPTDSRWGSVPCSPCPPVKFDLLGRQVHNATCHLAAGSEDSTVSYMYSPRKRSEAM